MPCAASEPASKPGRPLEIGNSNTEYTAVITWGWFRPVQGSPMTPVRILGIVLIVAGVLALVYGGFSHTKEAHKGEIRPVKPSLEGRQPGEVPPGIGAGAP